jgi:hypothetical protein
MVKLLFNEKITKLHNLQFEQGIVVYSEGYVGMYKHLTTALELPLEGIK